MYKSSVNKKALRGGAVSMILLLIIGSTFLCSYLPANREEIQEQLLRRSRTAASPQEKLSIFYNIFDLSIGDQRKPFIDSVYYYARELRDTAAMLDAIRHKTNVNLKSMEVVSEMDSLTSTFGPSDSQRETQLYVRMVLGALKVAEDTTHSSRTISQLMERYRNDPEIDPYERAELLFYICQYLEQTSQGELLQMYYNRLGELLNTLPLTKGAVLNNYLTRASIAYLKSENSAELLRTEWHLQRVMDSLVTAYQANGRPYRTLDVNRYLSYRRMLSCHSILPEDSVERYFNEIERLTHVNPLIASDRRINGRADIYYLMFKGRYAEALEICKRVIDDPSNKTFHLRLLSDMVVCARNTGNLDVLSQASSALEHELNERLRRNNERNAMEISLLNDLADLQEQNSTLEQKNQKAKIESQSRMVIALVLIIILLTSLIVLLFRRRRKLQRMAQSLHRANIHLENERSHLRHAQQQLIVARDLAQSADQLKTDFINNMSHEVRTPLAAIVEYSRLIVDCMPDDKQAYLNRYADNIEFNASLINNLVNEVLEAASLENEKYNADLRPESVKEICTLAFYTIFERGVSSKPDIKVIFAGEDKPDVMVNTDLQRSTQIVMNLLANANKFTEKGTITLDYRVQGDTVEISVTDTGIGIPEGYEEVIFERFRQLNNAVHGVGLGLYIARKLAEVLEAKVTVDREYRSGARMLLLLPKAGTTPAKEQ